MEASMYKTRIVDYSPRASVLAERIERIANEEERQGFLLVSSSVTPSAKAILIFHKEEEEGMA